MLSNPVDAGKRAIPHFTQANVALFSLEKKVRRGQGPPAGSRQQSRARARARKPTAQRKRSHERVRVRVRVRTSNCA